MSTPTVKTEPVRVTVGIGTVIASALLGLIGHQLHVDKGQLATYLPITTAIVGLVLSEVTRGKVTPQTTVDEALSEAESALDTRLREAAAAGQHDGRQALLIQLEGLVEHAVIGEDVEPVPGPNPVPAIQGPAGMVVPAAVDRNALHGSNTEEEMRT